LGLGGVEAAGEVADGQAGCHADGTVEQAAEARGEFDVEQHRQAGACAEPGVQRTDPLREDPEDEQAGQRPARVPPSSPMVPRKKSKRYLISRRAMSMAAAVPAMPKTTGCTPTKASLI